MQEKELNYYEKIGNWDFSQIKCKTENSFLDCSFL